MIEITSILCPIDFSAFSRHALDHAIAIARWYNARLTVLHVFSNFSAMDMPPAVLDEKGRQGIMAEMRSFTEHVPSDLRLDLRIGEASDIHREILAQAQATHADLLIIGSHVARLKTSRVSTSVGEHNMLKRTMLAALAASGLLAGIALQAQQSATFVLRSGEARMRRPGMGEMDPFEARSAWSLQGPPHIELGEVIGRSNEP